MQELLERIFTPAAVAKAGSFKPTAAAHSHMNAMERHQGKEAIYLTNEAFLFSHRFFVLGKVMELHPASIVDMGCGEGSVLKDLRHNMVLTPFFGIDSRPVLKTDKNSLFVQADFGPANEWPLREGQSDCIILSEVIEHFTKADGIHIIRNACQSLCSGGHLIVTLPISHPAESMEKDYKKYGHLHYWDAAELRDRFAKYGEVREAWGARFCRDRTSTQAFKALTAATYGEACRPLLNAFEKVYGTRVFKHAFAFVRDYTEATGMNLVLRRR